MNFWRLQGWLYEALFALVPHRNLVADTAASVHKTPGRVLDAGCGTGRLSKYAQCDVVGVDFSDTMLRVARKRGNKLVRADLCGSWPFASNSFAQVVSLNVLYALPDPKAMLAEAFRVLEHGGELKIASPTSEQLMPLVREHFKLATPTELLISILNIPRFFAWGMNLTIRGFFENSKFHFYSGDELVEMCQSVGFEVLSVSPCYAGIDAMIIARKW